MNVRINETDRQAWERALERANPRRNANRIVYRVLADGAEKIRVLATRKYMGRPSKGSPDRVGPGTLGIRTGALRRSIRVDRSRRPWRVDVGTESVYAATHEFGRPPIPARPYLQPAVDEVSRRLPQDLLDAWEREATR